MVRAFVALGSNLGDSARILPAAADALQDEPGIRVVGRSSLHESAPVGGPKGQPDYLNGVVELETSLDPLELLETLQGIESRFGRDRTREERWGPRLLDLDLLLHGDSSSNTERLELPHPRMRERLFVLEPLAELAPELQLAGGQTVRELLLVLNQVGP